MTEIKFGKNQINNPTPSRINLWVRVFTVTAGVFLGWMATTSMIGPNTKNDIASILGLLIGLVNGLAPLFGIDVTGKNVPVDQVTAMDEKKE